MAKKQPRIYFDHKAGITKIEGNRSKRRHCNTSVNSVDDIENEAEFEWKVESQLSWDTFVQNWENRHLAN